MNNTMTEEQFIAQEAGKLSSAVISDLERINHYGFLRSQHKTDTLLINGLIELSPPRPGFQYNHYKLTAEGWTALVSLRHTLTVPSVV